MKKIGIVITILLCFWAISCDFEIPKKIQIKTDPVVNVSAGEVDFAVKEKLTVESLQELFGESLQVYEYEKAEDSTLRYLLKANLMNQSFDFAEILDSMSITPSIENVIPEISVTVPKLSQTIEAIKIDIPKINVTDFFSSAADNIIVGCLQSSVDYQPVASGDLGLDFSLTGFETLEFGDNSVIFLDIGVGDYPEGFGIRIDSICLKDSSDNIIMEQELNQEIENGSKLILDVSNKILPKDLSINFAVSTKGTLGDIVSLGIALSIPETSSIVAVSGLTSFTLDSITIPEQVVSLPSDSFNAAVVKSGEIAITIPQLTSLNSDFQGITRKISLSIIQENGLNLSVENWNDNDSDVLTFDLAGQIINSNPIVISGRIDIDVASDIRIPQESCTAELTAALEITELASVSIVLQEGFVNSIHLNETIPEDIKNYLHTMDFNSLGFALTLNNGLPEGNDISVTVDSTCFGLSDLTKDFAAQQETRAEFVSQNATIDFQTLAAFDIDVTIGLPSYDEFTKTLTIYNVRPDSQIGISGSVEVIFDWERIEIAYKNGNIAGSFGGEEGSGLDLSMLSFLNETIKFEEFPLHLYAYVPGIKDVTFDASIKTAYLTEKDGEEILVEKYLVGTDENAATLSILSSVPAFTFKNDSQTCITALPQGSIEPIKGLSDIINAAPSKLSFDYALDLSNTIILTKEDVESLKEAPLALAVDLVLELPLSFVAYENAHFDILEIADMDKEKDLFGREEPSAETLDDMLVNSLGENATVDFTASLKLNYNNDLGIACSVYLVKEDFVKEIELKKGKNTATLALSREEMGKVWEMYPFNPTILLKIPGTEEGIRYALTRDSALEVTLGAQLKTEISYDISLESEE